MMKILMVHPHDLYSPSEPWTIRVKRIACEFVGKGHRVRLVYFPLDHRKANRRFEDSGIECISMDRRLGVWRLFRNTREMLALARDCDIIHFQKCYYYAALPALVAGWFRNKPVHYDWDDWETKIFYYSNPREFIIGEFLNLFEKLIPRVVNTVSVSSSHLRNLCLSRGVMPGNIFSAHVGADLEAFSPDISPRGQVKKKYAITGELVLYVGQLHGGQYAELFIKSAKAITTAHPHISFMLAGDGYRLGELKAMASMLGLNKHMIFTGAIAHSEIPYYIADADVCVASFQDNDITRCKSPLKIVEYLASGKAIVASNVGEVRNMVGGVGILTEPGDADSLAQGIRTLLGDKALRERLGVAARVRAQSRYNWSVTAVNILNAYEKAISSNGRLLAKKSSYNLVLRGGVRMNGDFKILTATVASVTEHKGAAHTIEIKRQGFFGHKDDSLTIDPRCSFYKGDEQPKAIGIVMLGDIIEATYLVYQGVKVAFNIIVKSK
jgi:glycosyltransferase involved in cell wall biosynthesis